MIALAGAAFLATRRPSRAQNGFLAAAMTADALGTGLGLGILYLVDDRWLAYNVQIYAVSAILVIPVTYLLFLTTLDTPLSRSMRHPAARGSLIVLAGALALWPLAQPAFFMRDVVHTAYATWDGEPGPGFGFAITAVGATALVGIAFAIWNWTPQRRTARRAQARAYLLAFGARDLLLATTILTGGALETTRLPGGAPTNALFAPLAVLLTVVLVGYGVLRAQLFDIDVKLRWTVSRATLAAIFLAVFLVVAQMAQNFLSAALGWLAGGIAAGLLLFVLAPLQRVAERVAHSAVPGATGTQEYVASRKLEVYKAAVESATEADGIGARERRFLAALQAKLGLSALDASAIEADVLAERSSRAPPVVPA